MKFGAVRRGRVSGADAIVVRVGFVGELSYEIHLPASKLVLVWKELLKSGANVGIRPFGVEAQRLLRLEKGHLIAGQDTDALTTPYEADASWAIDEAKSFFVGQRSLKMLNSRPLERKLVGVRWPVGDGQALPEECQLIIDGSEIVGRITSIAKQSTLGYPIGLAFVHPRLAKAGTQVQVRLAAGRYSTATVAELPFYDAAHARQEL